MIGKIKNPGVCMCDDLKCERKPAKGRRVSNTCKSRMYRSSKSIKAFFNEFKDSITGNGRSFDVSFGYFEKLIEKALRCVSDGVILNDKYSVFVIKEKEVVDDENIEVISIKPGTKKDIISIRGVFLEGDFTGEFVLIENSEDSLMQVFMF